MTRTSPFRSPATLFTLAAATTAAICFAILRTPSFAAHPDVAAWGVTFDLTLSIPLLYYLFVVRSGHAKPFTIAPLFIVCVAVAARVIPPSQHAFVNQLRWITAPLELVTIALIVRRATRMRSRERIATDDPLTRIRDAANSLLGRPRLASFIAFEVTTMYYAIFCWRKKDAEGFTFHRRAGWSSIVICILVLIAAESIGMHFLLGIWSVKAAWIMTALDVWGALWIIGDYHALRLRTTTVDSAALHLRIGLRWSATIAREQIASIDNVQSEREWKRRGVLKAAILEEPRYLVRLTEPIVVEGLAGITKRIDAIAMLPDDDALIEALRPRVQ
jgi:hypothetical protein